MTEKINYEWCCMYCRKDTEWVEGCAKCDKDPRLDCTKN